MLSGETDGQILQDTQPGHSRGQSAGYGGGFRECGIEKDGWDIAWLDSFCVGDMEF